MTYRAKIKRTDIVVGDMIMGCDDTRYTVYMHVNKINGKKYVGITGRDVEKRWMNGKGYKESDHFNAAINLYGWDNFDHVIVASGLTKAEACEIETRLIKDMNLQDPDYGYNISNGGADPSLSDYTKKKIGDSLRGRKYTEEKKRIYSEAHAGKPLSPQHAEAIRASRSKIVRTDEWNEHIRDSWQKYTGENHPNYGKKLSEDHIKKMHDAGKIFQSEHPELWDATRKKVMCVETGMIYNSIENAANDLNVARSSISENASGKRKSAGGYHWKFV